MKINKRRNVTYKEEREKEMRVAFVTQESKWYLNVILIWDLSNSYALRILLLLSLAYY